MARRSTPRLTELLLLAAAAPAVLLAFALVHAVAARTLTWADFAVPAGLFVAFVAAHVAVRRFAPYADPVILPATFLLSGIGLAMVTRLDPKLAISQVTWVFIGVAACVLTLVAVPSLERLARYKYTIGLVAVVLLVMPVFVGKTVNGAKLWISVGGLSFQPSEIAKVLLVIFLAAYLAENRDVLSVSVRKVLGIGVPAARHLGPLLAMWAVSLLILIGLRDLGSSLLFFGIFLVMFYVGTGRSIYTLSGIALFGAGAYVAFRLFDHVQTRVAIWLHPFADAQGKGYQLVQSLFSIGAGGVLGTGFGRGLPTRIPFVTTDFIFSAVAEELGLIGGVVILLVYLVIVYRALAIASRSRSDMAQLTAVGLAAALALQVFVIVGGVTRLIPLTGITLPFVSYGGSSLLANFIIVGLLLRTGDEAARVGALARETPTQVISGLRTGRRVTIVAWVVTGLFALLVVNLGNLMVFQQEALAANPANTRRLAEELAAQRGAIRTADGVVLARSVPAGPGRYRRIYPSGELAAHAVGYFSARYGRTGVESAMNETLLGKRTFASFADLVAASSGVPVRGNDVVLTIDSKVQRAAQEALAGRRGAVVAIDPRTGAVLALASNPTYAPSAIEKEFGRYQAAGADAPLVNRATKSLYPPGSTFKVVTLAGGFASKVCTPETVYPAPASMQIGGGKVSNFKGVGFAPSTVEQATARSINTVFGQIGAQIGADRLVKQADAFGFDAVPPIETGAAKSRMTRPDQMTEWMTAWAACGQPVSNRPGKVIGPVATPLQMALVAAGVGNNGVVMKPYLVGSIADPTGRVLAATSAAPWTTATSPTDAATVKAMMINAVENGSGRRAKVPGIPTAGKTGTAEPGKNEQTHAWFIGFAPADRPTVAIAIILENAGVGGEEAAPAARQVFEAALKR
jgi:peptidoglycan glycosyltransferase